MSQLKALDLFCGAGGATRGLQLAGFHVTGVDIAPQPRYVGDAFVQADITRMFSYRSSNWLRRFSFIWASPPCQHYSDLAARWPDRRYPDLIEPVRELLQTSGADYVIENVEGAPLHNPIMLCGTMFPGLRVIRHRLFESNVQLYQPPHSWPHPPVFTHDKRKAHYGQLDQDSAYVTVTGGGNCTAANARDAMQIDWMTKDELNEAIPPSYALTVALQVLGRRRLERTHKRAVAT